MIVFFFFFFFIWVKNVRAKENLVKVYYFYSNSCVYCKAERKFWHKVERKDGNVQIYEYEIHDNDNESIMEDIKSLYGIESTGVPFVVVGDKAFLGYSDVSDSSLIKAIIYYSKYNYSDRVSDYFKSDGNYLNYISISDNDSVNKFIKNYGNYKIVGLETNNLDMDSISFIVGLIMGCMGILGLFILMIFIRKFKRVDRLMFFFSYIFLELLFCILFMIYNFEIGLYILVCVIIVGIISRMFLQKNRWIILFSFIIGISCCSNILKYLFLGGCRKIFLMSLTIKGIYDYELMYQYFILGFTDIVVLVLFILMGYVVYNKFLVSYKCRKYF